MMIDFDCAKTPGEDKPISSGAMINETHLRSTKLAILTITPILHHTNYAAVTATLCKRVPVRPGIYADLAPAPPATTIQISSGRSTAPISRTAPLLNHEGRLLDNSSRFSSEIFSNATRASVNSSSRSDDFEHPAAASIAACSGQTTNRTSVVVTPLARPPIIVSAKVFNKPFAVWLAMSTAL